MIITEKTVQTVSEIVLMAGKMIRDRLGSTFLTTFKSSPADLVTEVDQLSQAYLLEQLERFFPDHIFIGEEGFLENSLVWKKEAVWFIDPLDGTTNFVFGIPFCAVTVSLTIEKKPALGVTYDPFRDELFTAWKGGGSFLNGNRIGVDKTRKKITESLITTGFPSAEQYQDQMLNVNYPKIFTKAIDVRAFGSAALELAYIACGRITGYWEVALRPWDVAAGMVLVEEAGGKISDLDGNSLAMDERISIVASNGVIHSELITDLTSGKK